MKLNLTTADDVAEQLQVSRQRVYELVRLERIPLGVAVWIGERQLRFDQDALREWIAKGGFAKGAQVEEPAAPVPVTSKVTSKSRPASRKRSVQRVAA
jgi:excisionase family DNA binding protein